MRKYTGPRCGTVCVERRSVTYRYGTKGKVVRNVVSMRDLTAPSNIESNQSINLTNLLENIVTPHKQLSCEIVILRSRRV